MAQIRNVVGQDRTGCNAACDWPVAIAVTATAAVAANFVISADQLELEISTFHKPLGFRYQVQVSFIPIAYFVGVGAESTRWVFKVETDFRLRLDTYEDRLKVVIATTGKVFCYKVEADPYNVRAIVAQVRYVVREDSAGCNAASNRPVAIAVAAAAAVATNFVISTDQLELEISTFHQ